MGEHSSSDVSPPTTDIVALNPHDDHKYPRHSKQSCSDANPINADVDGTGCHRCTAIFFQKADNALAEITRIRAAAARVVAERFEAQQQVIELRAELSAAKAGVPDAVVEFARWVIREYVFGGFDVDGCDVEDKATELGLLAPTQVTEPCCETCNCADVGERVQKPSWGAAPEWAEWLAMDATGRWYWYSKCPVTQGSCFVPPTNGQHLFAEFCSPSWEETLEPRPTNGGTDNE